MCRLYRLFASVFLLFLAGCGQPETAEWQVLPLPRLPEGRVPIRVAYAVNPRLTQMTPEQIQILLDSMRRGVKEHFGVELEFSKVDIIAIADLFRKIPEEERQWMATAIYDFRRQKGSRSLELAFSRELKKDGESLLEMINFSRPYLGELPERSHEALGSALAKYHLTRIERWRQIPALDGKPSIDEQPYNEFTHWSALGYGNVPYELVLTNQLIASVETMGPAVHSSLRGGYSNGITIYSKQSRYGTMVVWSTFAFTATDAWTKQLRGGETYDATEAAQLAGLAAGHETGHQLFHFGHPFAQPACLMYPVPMLTFRKWASALSAKNCRIGSSPAMSPGAYRFRYLSEVAS